MTLSDLSFVAKVVVLSGALGALIKYALPTMLERLEGAQELPSDPTLGLVVALLVAPSLLMGGLFWLRRRSIP